MLNARPLHYGSPVWRAFRNKHSRLLLVQQRECRRVPIVRSLLPQLTQAPSGQQGQDFRFKPEWGHPGFHGQLQRELAPHCSVMISAGVPEVKACLFRYPHSQYFFSHVSVTDLCVLGLTLTQVEKDVCQFFQVNKEGNPRAPDFSHHTILLHRISFCKWLLYSHRYHANR